MPGPGALVVHVRKSLGVVPEARNVRCPAATAMSWLEPANRLPTPPSRGEPGHPHLGPGFALSRSASRNCRPARSGRLQRVKSYGEYGVMGLTCAGRPGRYIRPLRTWTPLLAGKRRGHFRRSAAVSCSWHWPALLQIRSAPLAGANRRPVAHRAHGRVVPSRPALGARRLGHRDRRPVRPRALERGPRPAAHAGLHGQAVHHRLRPQRARRNGAPAHPRRRRRLARSASAANGSAAGPSR